MGPDFSAGCVSYTYLGAVIAPKVGRHCSENEFANSI